MEPIIKRQRVRVQAAEHARDAGGGCARPEQKHVRLLEEDGEVRAIELACVCGEVMVIELEYAERTSAPETTS